MAARIPAWKKLGLQLKNSTTSATERDTSLPVVANASSPSKVTKKRALAAENEEPNGKKQRMESGMIDDETKRGDAKRNAKKKTQDSEIKSSMTLSSIEQQDDKPEHKPKSKKRKSVSFAADTKSEDEDAELDVEYEDEDDHEPSPAAARKAEKKKLKREQRAKNRPGPTSPSILEATPTHPVLQYLSLYHKSRAQWKFQKNRETHLLKHALSVDRIPSAYNASLAAYLAGIKSEGAKKRVAEAAVEAIKAYDDDVDSEEKNGGDDAPEKDGYRHAITSFRRKLTEQGADPDSLVGDMVGDETTNLKDDWLKKLEKRRRAELVLHFAGGSVPTTQLKPVETKKGKNRKKRTSVVNDTTSSSSESDSDSDSDSESNNANSKPAIKQVNGTNGEPHPETSSSSESGSSPSSSSDSDSETSSNSSSDSDSD
ncbi:hypothetical protein ACJ72_03767 [Emergomyces africanus]|uniref:WKF domain-containing protein n=1 Tax=Emergomyces africanus TaxID=1955775 RepID=A0A1B7NYQ6_9EURO|nr:hypothetical protein ACJ72_03767 [Emergomyces africanus]